MTSIDADLIDILGQLPVGLCVVDGDLRIAIWNETLASWTGRSACEVQGNILDDVFPTMKLRGISNRIRSVLSTGAPTVFSASLHRHFVPVSESAQGMYQETVVRRLPGSQPRALICVEDMTHSFEQVRNLRTERKRLKDNEVVLRRRTEELVQANSDLEQLRLKADSANQSKSAFLANMSHEIRTPMTAILGYAEMLGDGDVDVATASDTIRRNGAHLLTIINDILDLSKIENGKLELQKEPTNVGHLLGEVIKLMELRAAEKKIGLVVEYESSIPKLMNSDSVRLRQILVNLVGNAIKFTGQGAVRVVARVESEGSGGEELVLTVVDTGIGIAEDELPRLFDRFEQGNATKSRKYGGTGLGLEICRRLASMMGGRIDVQSKVGVGSQFTVRLPIENASDDVVEMSTSKGPGSSAPDQSVSRSEPIRLDGSRILLAEDGVDNQRLIRTILEYAGASVMVVENGRAAVDITQQSCQDDEPFDLILMDIQMPEMDGHEATRTIRAAGIEIPIVALTANAMKDDEIRCRDLGFDGYHSKPIHRQELMALVDRMIQSGRPVVT